MSGLDAVVVGSGPNGLAAAVTLAHAGCRVEVLEAAGEIGGGTRSAELFESGVVHDSCSAVHPFGAGSPLFDSLDLESHGLRWRWAEVDLAHPLDDGRAAALVRSIGRSVAGMGADARAWRRAFGPLARSFPDLASEILRPIVHVPRHPVLMARFGLRALQPATLFARRFEREDVRALYGGIAAHSFQPLHRPTTAAAAAMLVAAAHSSGWPVAEGGSGAISAALVSLLGDLGGAVHTGVEVTSLRELPPSRVVLLDVSPTAAIPIVGAAMPAHVRRAFQRWTYGPAAFKVDLLVDGGLPWTNEACRSAGTVHCGGPFDEVVAAEAEVASGAMPQRPFVLAGQQYLADPGRSSGTHHPVWAYAHVPHGYHGDATDAVLGQIERFAPGARDRILAISTRTPAGFEAYNANYRGGDISTGANTPFQTVFRPRPAADPYRIARDVFLCSAATPPGPGVHGMCGLFAARSALRRLHRNP